MLNRKIKNSRKGFTGDEKRGKWKTSCFSFSSRGASKGMAHAFTTPREKDNDNFFSLSSNAGGASSRRGFTLIELLVVIAVISILAAVLLSLLGGARLDARDKRRISDVQQLQKALELYVTARGEYPKEIEGANGNVSTNTTFQSLIRPYLQGTPIDPSGAGNDTFFYYYDGSHNCGGKNYAVLIVRQMDRPQNSNYDEFFSTTCKGILDGEGRGGGQESYNILIGPSGG